jgi:hypothetical protein
VGTCIGRFDTFLRLGRVYYLEDLEGQIPKLTRVRSQDLQRTPTNTNTHQIIGDRPQRNSLT